MLSYLWQKISLFYRVMVSVGLVLFLVIGALLYSLIRLESERQRTEFTAAIASDLAILVPPLTEQALIGDYTGIKQVLIPYAQRPEVEWISWVDPTGHAVTATGTSVSSEVPAWFARLLDIQGYEGWQEMSVGGTSYGQVGIRMDPTATLNKTWAILLRGGAFLVLGLSVLLGVILVIIRQALRPLQRLAEDVQRFSEGEYTLRTPLEGPPEISTSLRAFNSMANRMETPLASLQENEARVRLLAAVVEQSVDSILTCDLSGIITSWNRGAERLLGWSAEQAIGKSMHALHMAHLNPEEFAQILERVHSGKSTTFEEQRRNHLGDTLYVSWTTAPLLDEEGKGIGEIGIARDITALKQAQDLLRHTNETLEIRVQERTAELAQAKEVAETANRAKSDFLANMSHEIRTPMNGVLGMTEILLQTDLNEQQRYFAQTVQNSGTTLLRVLNEILDFSKIEAGRLELETIDFPLWETVENTVQLFAELARAKGLELASYIDQNVPTALRGDPGRIQQILSNLVGNAIKFTEHGEVIVRVEMTEQHDDYVGLRFTVRDTGIGISASAQKHIFDAFSQEDTSTTRRYGGTGLGLTISRELVHRMHGKIGLESEVGRGSMFWFTVRLGWSTSPTPKSASGAIPQPHDLQGLCGLIVDDNATNCDILNAQLQGWGMQVRSARGGQEALRMLQEAGQEPYWVAILDLEMPEMDGIELARAIRQMDTSSALHIVLLSSVDRDIPAALRQELRIARSLTKPISQAQLSRCLKELSHPAKPIHPPSQTLPNRNIPRFAATLLLAEDNAVNQAVARTFLKKLGCEVDLANNGREAVEAIARKRYDLVLMDCQMPEMDGFQAVAIIRQSESNSGEHVPIIALTAHAIQGDRDRCLAAGMDDYLAKPFNLGQLGAILQRWLPTVEKTDTDVTADVGSSQP